jgi:hypothetical protein
VRRRRFTRPSVEPETEGPALDALFKSLKLDDTARSFRACRAFSRAVGPVIRARARGERLQGALLFVRTVSSVWSQHLSVERRQIVEKLQRTPGGEGVNDLRFIVGPLEELPDWDAKLDAIAPAPSAAPDAPPLPTELEGAVASVADPELRELLAAAARHHR